MSNETQTATTGNKKPTIIILAILVVAALGVGGYLTSDLINKEDTSSNDTYAEATGGPSSEEDTIVVARVNDEDITIADVKTFVNNIPQLQGQPIQNVFPLVQEQLVSAEVVGSLADSAGLENDPEVKKRLAVAKKEIIRTLYVEKELERLVTEEKLQSAYKAFLAQQPEVKEVRARHILVEKEDEAKAIITKLNEGADFADLAKEKSTGPTGANGGDLGYFADGQMVPEFSKAAFALEKGAITKAPVKTQFGYHVIKLEDKRIRPSVPYEQAKQFLEAQERKTVLNGLLAEWKNDADIEIFDINGKEIEPAAGDEHNHSEAGHTH